jgi:hypothetical protein
MTELDYGNIYYTSDEDHEERLRPNSPGGHIWTAVVTFRITNESARASVISGEFVHLDVDSIVTTSVLCHQCEERWSPLLASRRCAKEPKW